MDLDYVCAHAGRSPLALTRRDVARALLAVPSGVALVALPDLRKELLAAGNPLSVTFWESAKATLSSIEAGQATVGDVQRWLEATGTEPILLTSTYFLWPEEDERGPVAEEMHARLVAELEALVEAGTIDPDALARGEGTARRTYEQVQEAWLNTPLPDGRVPEHVVAEEQDAELMAGWDEQEELALSELRRILDELPARPGRPQAALEAAASRLRQVLDFPGYPGNVLRACAGFDDRAVPEGAEELWLAVTAGVAGPISDLPEEDDDPEEFGRLDEELTPEDEALAALCSISHADWLAVVAALARLGPGTPASPERLARLVADSVDVEQADDEPDDVETLEGLFVQVVALWAHLGVVDEDEALTPLGWWGLPAALERAWSPE
ncbi:hypothetical protein ACIBG7_33645 [Nonomuraea sp. NPDC050328]|uniref:hypothetical protein n=1 Tax=Nonomuraea sp. NPDC050328 TaxID=3364361 RepID=UPI0037BBA2C4